MVLSSAMGLLLGMRGRFQVSGVRSTLATPSRYCPETPKPDTWYLIAKFSRLQRSHFAQPAQVSFGLTVLSRQERLYKVPSHSRPHGPAAHAKDVHVIVLDSLLGGEVIVNERGASTPNFVGAHRRANSTATDGHTAVHLSGDHRLG